MDAVRETDPVSDKEELLCIAQLEGRHDLADSPSLFVTVLSYSRVGFMNIILSIIGANVRVNTSVKAGDISKLHKCKSMTS